MRRIMKTSPNARLRSAPENAGPPHDQYVQGVSALSISSPGPRSLAQYRYVSCQILYLRRPHRAPEPSPMAGPQRLGDNEVQALPERSHRAVAEQRLGARAPPRDLPVRIGN